MDFDDDIFKLIKEKFSMLNHEPQKAQITVGIFPIDSVWKVCTTSICNILHNYIHNTYCDL